MRKTDMEIPNFFEKYCKFLSNLGYKCSWKYVIRLRCYQNGIHYLSVSTFTTTVLKAVSPHKTYVYLIVISHTRDRLKIAFSEV